MTIVNSVTPKAAAKQELLLNKPTSIFQPQNSPLLKTVQDFGREISNHKENYLPRVSMTVGISIIVNSFYYALTSC
jgi:hypothetical protein